MLVGVSPATIPVRGPAQKYSRDHRDQQGLCGFRGAGEERVEVREGALTPFKGEDDLGRLPSPALYGQAPNQQPQQPSS